MAENHINQKIEELRARIEALSAEADADSSAKTNPDHPVKTDPVRPVKTKSDRPVKPKSDRPTKTNQDRPAKTNLVRLAKTNLANLARLAKTNLANLARLAKTNLVRPDKTKSDHPAETKSDRPAKINFVRLARTNLARLAKNKSDRPVKPKSNRPAEAAPVRPAKRSTTLKAAALATALIPINAGTSTSAPERDSEQNNTEMTTPIPANRSANYIINEYCNKAATTAGEIGMNTMEVFDLSDIVWDAEMATGIQGSETSNRIASNVKVGRRYNRDKHHCLAGVKAIMRKSDLNIDDCGGSAYMAINKLRTMPEFTEIKCDYSVLPYLPEGTIVVQDKGQKKQVKHGHIFVTKQQGDQMVQECGQPGRWTLPTDNRRGKSQIRYGDMHVFIPSDCMIGVDTFITLFKKGCLKPHNAEILNQEIAAREPPEKKKTYYDFRLFRAAANLSKDRS